MDCSHPAKDGLRVPAKVLLSPGRAAKGPNRQYGPTGKTGMWEGGGEAEVAVVVGKAVGPVQVEAAQTQAWQSPMVGLQSGGPRGWRGRWKGQGLRKCLSQGTRGHLGARSL